MKKFAALLLVLAMLLPACDSATDGADRTASSQLTSLLTVASTTTAEPTVPTDSLPATSPLTDAPQTNPVTTLPATDTPVTTPPSTTAPVTSTEPVASTDTPVTDAPVTAAPHTHSYGAWKVTKAATCTVAGSETRTCTCGDVQTRSIAATGHSYGAWKVTKAAACTVAGSEARTCTCGDVQTRSIAATGHSYNAWKVTKTATCGADGNEQRVCACGSVEYRKIPATGDHDWNAWRAVTPITSTAPGEDTHTCRVCNLTASRLLMKAPSSPSLMNLFPVDNASRAQMVSSTAGGFTNDETAVNLFDSAPYTKLCTNNTGYSIVWKLDSATSIIAYSLVMGNDTGDFGRQPTAWTLEASLDGNDWTTVSTVNNGNIPRQNYAEKLYTVEAGDYQYFRFTLRAPNEMTQMSEITLYTNEIPRTPAQANALDSDRLDDSANMTAGIDYIKRIINDYYLRDTHIVGEQPGQTWSTTLWPATSFLEAVAEAYRACPDDPYIYSTYVDLLNNCLPGNFRVEATINTPNRGAFDVVYYNAVANSRGDYYYDDDAWVCLQYLNAYDLLGDERYLELAEESLEFFWTGWDDELGGGIYWDKSYSCKNTCADGPIAIAYLRAYELTGKEDYLEKGKMIYDWLRKTLLQNNLYADNINLSGQITAWKAAYNQGTPMAAGALLYRITGDKKYYDETTAVWNATISHMFRGSGANTTMNGNPIYRAWCVGWLVRGFEMYYIVDDAGKTAAMDKMLSVLEDERGTVNYGDRTGYYDPYFCTGDYADESMTQILQTAGVACTFLLAGFYELSLK